MTIRPLVQWSPTRNQQKWLPTTLDKLGKYEEFLEDALANSPELMMLESRRTGIRGPFKLFRQLALRSPSGRSVAPDIVLLSTSGHVVVVEVKRYVNPELKDRAVIAQIIDYASSFSALSEADGIRLFGEGKFPSWMETVQSLFPEDHAPDELAADLLSRMQSGEINLVIACDKVPLGLPEIVAGISTQRSLGFDLDLLEVTPYVSEISDYADILLVPSTRVATEIVSRTAITVTYRPGDVQPSTTIIQTTSVEEIEDNIKSATRIRNPNARIWTADEIEQAIRDSGREIMMELFEFCKMYSDEGQIIAPGAKQNPNFGLYVKGLAEGLPKRKMLLLCNARDLGIGIYLRPVEAIFPKSIVDSLRDELRRLFGAAFDSAALEPTIPLAIVEGHFEAFKKVILGFIVETNALMPTPE